MSNIKDELIVIYKKTIEDYGGFVDILLKKISMQETIIETKEKEIKIQEAQINILKCLRGEKL